MAPFVLGELTGPIRILILNYEILRRLVLQIVGDSSSPVKQFLILHRSLILEQKIAKFV